MLLSVPGPEQVQRLRLRPLHFRMMPGQQPRHFPASFAYYNLYIHGIAHMGNSSTVTVTTIMIPDGDTLDPATPVLVEFVVT